MRVIGMMSGTSYDAIDVAAAEFGRTGDTLELRSLGALSVPYEEESREAIAAVLPPAGTTVEAVCRLTTRLGHAYAHAARRGLAELAGGRADLVVSHGQTVFHWVEAGRALGSLQLGQPAFVAAATGLPVLSDLRAADIAAGGQGAPLVPVFDALLLAGGTTRRAALNLGGIANITVLEPDRAAEPTAPAPGPAGAEPTAPAGAAGPEPAGGPRSGGGPGDGTLGRVLGYDTGPANALIDLACRRFFGEAYDADGRHAAAGTVRADLLGDLLAEPYYAAPPPKSTGKELFHAGYLAAHLDRWPGDVVADDVVATLTELTARTVADRLRVHGVGEVVGAGGGMRNPVLVDRIAALSGARVCDIGGYGIDPDAKEAYAFALLGWLSWHGLPGALPSVTGARRPAVLGSLTPAAGMPRLPDPSDMPRRLVVDPVR